MEKHVKFEDIERYIREKVYPIPASFAYLSRKGSTFRLRKYLLYRIKVIPGVLKTRPEILGSDSSPGNKCWGLILGGSTVRLLHRQILKIASSRCFLVSINNEMDKRYASDNGHIKQSLSASLLWYHIKYILEGSQNFV